MAWPYLPEEETCPMFRPLERNASTPELMDLASYMASSWIVETSEWSSSSWSAHMKLIDTNNGVEGWHLRLNGQASGKSQLPFYLLVKLLRKEALLTSLQIRLVSEKKLRRIQREKYKWLQSRLLSLWEEFNNGQRNAKQLLIACSYLTGPVLLNRLYISLVLQVIIVVSNNYFLYIRNAFRCIAS